MNFPDRLTEIVTRVQKMEAVIDDEHRDLRETVLTPAEKNFYAYAPADLAYLLTRLKAAEAVCEAAGYWENGVPDGSSVLSKAITLWKTTR